MPRRPLFVMAVMALAAQLACGDGSSSSDESMASGEAVSSCAHRYPADANVVDVVAQYGAKGDGVTDDTAAIAKAISDNVATNGDMGHILYFPAGTYIVCGTLAWRRGTDWGALLTLQGATTGTTILKLKDRCAGFGDPTHPKAFVYTASTAGITPYPNWAQDGSGNAAFRNSLRDLTIDTGKGNPGAIGVDYLANNTSEMRNVVVRSGDGAGVTGISMTRKDPGPTLLTNVEIDGFDAGVAMGNATYGATFEHITLKDQNKVGMTNASNVMAIRRLDTSNSHDVPVITNTTAAGLVSLVGGTFNYTGTKAATSAAIVNGGSLFARNVAAHGYASAIDESGSLTASPVVEHASPASYTQGGGSLNLPISDPPGDACTDPSTWVSVVSRGARPDDTGDDTAAIQAALDSGASTIYFPTGRYQVSKTLHVRGTTRTILGLESKILVQTGGDFDDAAAPAPVFRIENGTTATVTIDGFWGQSSSSPGVTWFEHATSRTLVLRYVIVTGQQVYAYRSRPGAGNVFIEDVSDWQGKYSDTGGTWLFAAPQNVWARHFNPESKSLKIKNQAANLWILGLKTERPSAIAETTGTGQTELLGGLMYPVQSVAPGTVAFTSDGANHSLVYAVAAYAADTNYPTQVSETRDGKKRTLTTAGAVKRGSYGATVPLFVGRN